MKHGGEWQFSPYNNRKGEMMGASVRMQGHKNIDLNIIFPHHTAWWGEDEEDEGWIQQADAHEVLITLRYLEQALCVSVGASPGRVGWSYLKKIRPEWIEEIPGIDLRACHFDREAMADIIWERPLLSIERRKKYLHKFDKAAAYPYAATQTDIGVGTPVHVEHGRDAVHEKGHPQAVGVWRCTITYDGSLYNPLMPRVWKEDKGSYAATEGWLAGPIIRLLRKAGHKVTVHEGYVFPERHDVLLRWGKDLWEVRQGFLDDKWVNKKCADLARQATKFIMNSTIGIMAFKDFDDTDEMKRPDIRMQIIARHRELTWHNIDKVRTMYGVTPICVYMDAAYYVSDEPDGRKAFPELVKREGQFGGYRWEGRVEITPDVMEMWDAKMGTAYRLRYLNRKGWAK